MSRSRNWIFTINNYTNEDEELVRNCDCRYLICGHEVGEQGTPHLQGFVMYNSLKSMKQLSTTFPRARLQVAKGDSSHNYDYCSKEDPDFIEIGERPISKREQGQREKERWAKARKLASEGNMDDIPDDIYIRYYRTLKQIGVDHLKPVPDNDNVCGVWIYGPPGTGKSRKARADYPGIFDKPCNKWWDGYKGGPVLLDDFEHKCLGHLLKRWADRYAFTAEVKGGTINIRPPKIVVTSNYSIEEIFGDDHALCGAINRRFEAIFLP